MILEDNRLLETLLEILKPSEQVDPVEWIRESVYLPSGPYKGYYDIDLFPFWREVIEDILDPDIEELIIQKSSQAGATQLMISLLAFILVNDPAPIAYVGPNHDLSEELRVERIEPVLRSSKEIGDYYKAAINKDTDTTRKKGSGLYLANGASLITLNSGSTSDSKSRSIKYLFCDEIDAWATNTLDKYRSRITHYRGIGGKLIAISAPDVSAKKNAKRTGKKQSPIFSEIEKTDKRKYFLSDKKTDEKFTLEFKQLKWDKNAKDKDSGKYDKQLVRQSVKYISPLGTEYTQREIQELIAQGSWQATDNSKHIDKRKRGYIINALYYRSWGDLAIEFIEAQEGGYLTLRTFIAEQLGEEWIEDKREAQESVLDALVGDYSRGERYFVTDKDNKSLIKRVCTVDVQKYELYYMISDIQVGTGDISVITWGTVPTFQDLADTVKSYKSNYCLVDSNYHLRRTETLIACLKYKWIPCIGLTTSSKKTLSSRQVDPYEGTAKQGRYKVILIDHNTELEKHEIYDRYTHTSSSKLYLYKHPDKELTRQLLSETYQDGEWIKQHKDNHLFDCLVLVITCINVFSLGKKLI